jgi:hypothetical protein
MRLTVTQIMKLASEVDVPGGWDGLKKTLASAESLAVRDDIQPDILISRPCPSFIT